MQKYFYSSDAKNKISAAFSKEPQVTGKTEPRFPEAAEREYIRAVNQYMKAVKRILESEMPNLKAEYQSQQDFNTDSVFDFSSFVTDFLQGITDKLNAAGAAGRLIKSLRKIGKITKRHEISEWRRLVKKTLGLDLSEDYYNGDFYESELEKWVSDNVDLIKTVPQSMLEDMKEIIAEGYDDGRSGADIAKQIQKRYEMSKSHAQFIARDQMAKLSADITRKQHEDAGVTKYEWSTSGDSRVRPGHALLEGKIFEYANPPEIMEWRESKNGGRWISTGRRCNPGQDYNCRCVALPVFEEETLSLPLEDSK